MPVTLKNTGYGHHRSAPPHLDERAVAKAEAPKVESSPAESAKPRPLPKIPAAPKKADPVEPPANELPEEHPNGTVGETD